jgi:hypothetical protein
MADSNASQRQIKEALKHQERSWASFMQTWKIPLILAYYGFCSSTLIVINKVAVHTLQAPVFILVLQLLFSAVVVKGLNFAGVLEAEGLQWNLVKPFMLIVLGFLGTLYGECCRHYCTAAVEAGPEAKAIAAAASSSQPVVWYCLAESCLAPKLSFPAAAVAAAAAAAVGTIRPFASGFCQASWPPLRHLQPRRVVPASICRCIGH